MKVLDAEKNIGIETFLTSNTGLGGKLRTYPEDFVVQEISNPPDKNDDGIFTIAKVTSTNWETNLLIRELSNILGISRQRIGFAGTKDKRAKTTQLMSFYKIKPGLLSDIHLKNVNVENVFSSKKAVKMGSHFGNSFEIKVRNIKDSSENSVKTISDEILKAGGFPNFYGVQRFGIIRPITHVVGKYMVMDDFEKAAMTYIGNPVEGEDEDTYELRKNLEKTRDYGTALQSYPNFLSFEKAILNKLVVDPNDFVGALGELPKNLLTMFIYAYQSYLFNKILSIRIKQDLPLNKAVVGDVILPIRKGVLDGNGILVKDSNIDKVNFQISKGKAVVSSILFGTDTVFSQGEMGEIEHKVIEKEKIRPGDFIIPDMPFVSSKGSRRPILAFVNNLDYSFDKKEKNVILSFDLKKGCYATCILREFMKADDIKNY